MTQKKMFSTFVLLATSVFASLGSAEVHFMSYDEWEEISSQFQGNKHQITLKDGSALYGRLTKLPSLHYAFAAMDFDAQEILAVVTVNMAEGHKLQYVCRNGQNYIASYADETFVFSCEEKTSDGNYKEITKEIDPQLIDYIILYQPSIPFAGYNSNLASLEFQNGDQLPVILLSDTVVMTDGWSEKNLNTKDIASLSFQGGVHARIIKEGRKIDMDFSYIKDPYLGVLILRNQHHMKFPWAQIAQIQTGNGGFYRDGDIEDPRLQPSAKKNRSIEHHTHKIGLGWHKHNDAPDQIGLTKGVEFSEAYASLSISKDAIVGLKNIGNETIVAADPLFEDSDIELEIAILDIDNFEVGEEIPSTAIAEIEGMGNETIAALDHLFDEPDAESDDEYISLSDWLMPLLSSDIPEDEDRYGINFDAEDLDMYHALQNSPNENDLAKGEDFDIQDNIDALEREDTEMDYLEEVALEVDMDTLIEQNAVAQQVESGIIGIDEIISQDNVAYTSDLLDPTEIVDILWSYEDQNALTRSETEAAFVDSLWD